MVRSLYSGVTGMKGHQTRLDVIGNNIANVNTMGFKSSTATFRDVYYQSLRGAAGGNGTKGGVNSSMVGYGSKVSSIDLNMTQSISSTTGNPWDVSIGGEGFFQVQDSSGNIFYTRSGKFGYDNMGYLVDSNGNYVLGTQAQGNKVVGQKPGSSRIQMLIPSLNPTQASATNTINNVQYTVTAQNTTTDGNVAFYFLSENLPAGVPAVAEVSSTGISVFLNKTHEFANLDALNNAINTAITEGNNGKQHPAGTFTLTTVPADAFSTPLTGAQICDPAGATLSGSVTGEIGPLQKLGFGFDAPPTGDEFYSGGDCTEFRVTYADGKWTVEMDITPKNADGSAGTKVTYKQTVTGGELASGKIRLVPDNGKRGDYITLVCPTENGIIRLSDEYKKANTDNNGAEIIPKNPDDVGADGKPVFTGGKVSYTIAGLPLKLTGISVSSAQQSDNLGLSGNAFTLQNGTEGGPQSLADISGFKINAGGVIEATHNGVTLELGRIDLATFDNPSGLEQVGNTYFANTSNTGSIRVVEPGMGGSGVLASSTLEMSNVDLAQEFADVITTQRGYQANSRMITVSDTLLEELINLKR